MIAFIDTEVDPQTMKVADYGAVREDGAVLHSRSKADFDAFVSKCDTICGHNIFNHNKHDNMDNKTQFRPMRRFKQQMTDEACIALLQKAPRGVLAVLGDGGYPYTVPLDFVYDDGKIYFHCAKEGHKLDAIKACDKVSFCVLSEGVKEPDSWWYHFKSVVCFGRMHIVEDPAQKNVHLRLLGAKYFPQDYDIDADMAQDAPNAFVLELQIEHMSGKRVREK